MQATENGSQVFKEQVNFPEGSSALVGEKGLRTWNENEEVTLGMMRAGHLCLLHARDEVFSMARPPKKPPGPAGTQPA